MAKCWRCKGRGQVEISPAAFETCKQCGGNGTDKKPKCEKWGRIKFYDPNGIQGWLCPKCDQYEGAYYLEGHHPVADRRKEGGSN